MDHNAIRDWLREEDAGKLETLWQQADACRIAHVGHEVHLRGLIEISNICARRCSYCGISAENRTIARYRMTDDEIMDSARRLSL
jgi:biotin synthase